MAKISVTIEDQLLLRVRARANSLGTTPARLVREYLEAYARTESVRALAFQTLLAAPPPDYRGEREWAEPNMDEADRPLRLVR